MAADGFGAAFMQSKTARAKSDSHTSSIFGNIGWCLGTSSAAHGHGVALV